MDLHLEGKVVLITGGSKGLGFACADAFLAEGARVAICSRSPQNVERACAGLPGVFSVAGDCADAGAAAAMIDRVEDACGPIAILVNSAGAAQRRLPPELTPTAWRDAFDAKFFSYVNVIDPLVKRMAGRGAGVIVNIIGAGGKVASPTHLAGGSATPPSCSPPPASGPPTLRPACGSPASAPGSPKPAGSPPGSRRTRVSRASASRRRAGAASAKWSARRGPNRLSSRT